MSACVLLCLCAALICNVGATLLVLPCSLPAGGREQRAGGSKTVQSVLSGRFS